MSLKQLFSVSIVVMLLLSFAVVGVFLKYGDAVSSEKEALVEQKKAIALSEEMAGDSRGLTENIRLYGLTGEVRYKDAYMRILDESNGKVARSDGTVFSFMEKVENFGVTKEELKALNDAKNLSNGLAVIETEVMNAIDARIAVTGGGKAYRDRIDPSTVQQLVRLFDDEYYLWIGKIGEAVGRFNKSLFTRTGKRVAESQKNEDKMSHYFFATLGVFIVFNISLLILLWRSISRSIGGEPKLMEEVAAGIAAGDLSVANRLNRASAQGVAKAMLGINDSLERLVQEMSGSLDQIKQGKLRMACDESKFTGAYKGLLASTNQLMANIVSYFDLIATPIMCVDNKYNILFINKKGAELGNKQPTQLQDTKCHDLFRTDACQKSDCICDRAMKANGVTSGSTVAHPLGKEMLISYSAAPIKSDSGEVIGAFEQVFDETAIKSSQQKMMQVAGNATNIADRLASAAEELSSQVEQSSNGTDTQRERVGETATAMEQMNATVLEVAQNASYAADNAENSRTSAHEGSSVVGQLIDSIQLAERAAKGLKEHMAQLGDQAQGIGGIMSVISDIADQTNLLALNAAIEAARAGDAGRGFAVVADEVRKLAEKTMVATSEVSNAVSSIQNGTQVSIASTDQAVEAIMRSTEYANNSQSELAKIVGYAETTADQVRAIATSAEEQSAVAEEITRATDEVSQIAFDVAQAMQQSNQAVRELAELAGELRELISELTDK
ncbi:methyl-accepting chemotaxis protein [Oleidesulfovibrio sp.]|uniref:methyl-accepting chemotaxis protein n=1 Tax=Oleidesulfovibrio sp. TaxID=2909707 RepID=UPI003A881F14